MPSTWATKRTGLCIGCREKPADHPRDIIIYESVDGNFYGTDLTEGCMERVGVCKTAGEALSKMYTAGIIPWDWEA